MLYIQYIVYTHTHTYMQNTHTHTHTHSCTTPHRTAPHYNTPGVCTETYNLFCTYNLYHNAQDGDVTCRILETAGLYKFSSSLVCHCNMQEVGFRVCVRVVVRVLCQPRTGIQTRCVALQLRATHCTTHTPQRTAYVLVTCRRMYVSL